jgi:16S rRNA (cytosine967-C5)-methyltransferase
MLVINPRFIATQVLYRVVYRHESLTDVLSDNEVQHAEDKALIQDICFGSLRHFEHISAILTQLLVKPLKKKDKDIECLLRVGLYQLIYQRIPDHAAVNETVVVTKKLKKKWSRGLVNGVLRSFLRDKDNILHKTAYIAQRALPVWLLKRLKVAWPNDWQQMVLASNQKAPMTLRLNLNRYNPSDYLQKLEDKEIKAQAVSLSQTAIQLETPCNVYDLPEFEQGTVSVQDCAAQYAAQLLDCQRGMRVLDACAAPGGKTGHILETAEQLDVVAVDNRIHRLKRVKENLQRLQYQAECICADVADIESWWDQQLFDRILLDAPCSATGVIRRHPDIKLLREESDIANLQQQQRRILDALWPLVKTGGRLLYATCSILPEENEQQISAFLAENKDAKICVIEADWGIACQYGRQILSGQEDMDGFYYALLEKC